MFEELGRIVDNLTVPPTGDAIVEITAIRDRIEPTSQPPSPNTKPKHCTRATAPPR